MEIRVAGNLSNIAEAVREVQHIYPDAPRPGLDESGITEDMLRFMTELVRNDTSRALFLWLLQITLEITAPQEWWQQSENYFSDLRWVRRHPSESDERALLTQHDFEGGVPSMLLETLNDHIKAEERDLLAASLPDNFIRRGYANSNYGELRTIFVDRGHYNRGHWKELTEFLDSLTYNKLLTLHT